MLSRIDTSKLAPLLLERLMLVLDEAKTAGMEYWAISGFRTYAEQAALYFQGRTGPGKIVTNARPGYSAHNFGLAVDLCPDKDAKRSGLQPSWENKDYALLGQLAAKHGLEWAGNWKHFREMPHVQLPNISLLKARILFEETGGNEAYWAAACK